MNQPGFHGEPVIPKGFVPFRCSAVVEKSSLRIFFSQGFGPGHLGISTAPAFQILHP